MDSTAFTVLQGIKKKNPDLVQTLLDKWERDGQTIYGDLNDYMKDMYSNIDTSTRDEIVKHLIADYVIKHPYCLQKVYIVQQEIKCRKFLHRLLDARFPCSDKLGIRLLTNLNLQDHNRFVATKVQGHALHKNGML